MMGFRLIAFGAIAAALGTWFLMPASPYDPIVSASIKSPGQSEYTISNMERGTACLISGGKTVSARSHRIDASKDCDSVWPGLASARNWTQNEDGTVVLTDGSGSQLLTLGLGDGVDFVSLEPSNAVLALNILH
jgi:hypothetical protein